MGSSKTSRLLAYLGVPAAFCLAGYAVLWLALQPVWGLATAAAGFLFSSEAPAFNQELTSIYDPSAVPQAASEPAADWIDGADVVYPTSGEQYGRITCEQIGLDAPVYWYDSDDILAVGVGQSLISLLPGFGRSIILSGHNTTFFKCLQGAEAGNVIHFDTHYGAYEYTIRNVQVYDENDLQTLLLNTVGREQEELILYTCYPFHAISGRKTERLVVFADRTRGLDVRWREES